MRMVLYNQGSLADGPFRLNRYPRCKAALRKALAHRRFSTLSPCRVRLPLHLSKLSRSELIAALGGLVLLVEISCRGTSPTPTTATRSS